MPYVQKKESPHLVVERGVVPRPLVACRKKIASAALLSARLVGNDFAPWVRFGWGGELNAGKSLTWVVRSRGRKAQR